MKLYLKNPNFLLLFIVTLETVKRTLKVKLSTRFQYEGSPMIGFTFNGKGGIKIFLTFKCSQITAKTGVKDGKLCGDV